MSKQNAKEREEYLKRLTLLYVEDEELTREISAQLLSRYVGKLITANNGLEGLNAYREHAPDMILTDVQMPQMNGLAMVREIRSQNKTIPIIILTAFDQIEYLTESINIGVDKYVTKPVNGILLKEALTTCAHRMLVEETVRDLERKLQQLQVTESLGRMAAAVAHIFNNSLCVIMGNLELAQMKLSSGQEAAANLTEAMRAASRAAEVSSMMMTYLGQSPVHHVRLDLAEACQLCLPAIRASLPDNLELETGLPGTGPHVMADASQLQQLLTNLVTNAREAVGDAPGTVRLEVGTVPAAEITAPHRFPPDWRPQDQAYACLKVVDSGIGIQEEDMKKLFEPFFTSKFAGRGLGLAVVAGIVRMHNGAVTAENNAGSGCTFTVYLPLADTPSFSRDLPPGHDPAAEPVHQ